MQDLASILAINVLLAGVLYGMWRVWRIKQPMTVRKLARTVAQTPVQTAQQCPCEGALAPCLVLMQTKVADAVFWYVLLYHWQQQGALTVTLAPKRQLHGFGAEQQLQLTFAPQNLTAQGAERQMFVRLCQYDDTQQGLQQSQLYLFARDQAHALQGDFAQLQAEGRAYLRAHGMAKAGDKNAWFGFADPQEIYTPRGVRTAAQLRDFYATKTHDQPLWWLGQSSAPQDDLGTLATVIAQGKAVGGNARGAM